MSNLETSTSTTNTSRPLPLRHQLRFTLSVTVVILVVVSIAVVTAFTLVQLRTQSVQQTFRQLESVVQLKQNQLQRWLESTDTALHLALADSERYNRIVEILSATETMQSEQDMLNTELSYVVDRQTPEQTSETRIFTDLFVYNTDGHVLIASDPVQLDKVVNIQPYFDASLLGEFIQPPFYEVGSGALTMFTTLPITNTEGQLVGVIAARLNINVLVNIMTERAGLGDSGETILVSTESNYFLTPSRFEGYPLLRAYTSDGIDRALNGQNGFGVYQTYRNPPENVLGVYRWIPELSAALLAEITETEAQALFVQTSTLIIALVLISVMIAAGIGLYAAVRITHPIIALTQVASRIAGGDLTQRVQSKERNEIGLLATAFNQMAEAVEYRDKVQIAKLVELNQSLEERLVDVQIAREQAERSDKVKSAFLASMSHELRTPLNAIINFTRYVAKGSLGSINQRQAETLGEVVDSSKHLLNLINDVLDMSKIEAGSLTLFVEDNITLQPIVDTVISTGKTLVAAKPIVISSNIEDNLPVIRGDRQRILQVLLNVMSNACKFTEEGFIQLKAYHVNGEVIFAIEDSGPGIALEDQPAVFEAFKQTNTGLRQGGGTGLGMPISKSLAEAHGGRLWLESEIGKGATFYIAFPIKSEALTPSLVA